METTAMERNKPILCLDFDGVLHSYTSGWKGADVIPDPPVPGAIEFVIAAVERFEVHIFSSRSHQDGGIAAMQTWIARYLRTSSPSGTEAGEIFDAIQWPTYKPPAQITIDDRALTFEGNWPDLDELAAFKPWNKREPFINEQGHRVIGSPAVGALGREIAAAAEEETLALLFQKHFRDSMFLNGTERAVLAHQLARDFLANTPSDAVESVEEHVGGWILVDADGCAREEETGELIDADDIAGAMLDDIERLPEGKWWVVLRSQPTPTPARLPDGLFDCGIWHADQSDVQGSGLYVDLGTLTGEGRDSWPEALRVGMNFRMYALPLTDGESE